MSSVSALREKSILEHVPEWSANMGKNVLWATRDAFAAPVEWKDTAVVFASGASLSRYDRMLHALNGKVTVVATPSNVPWLLSQGVKIDLVVVMDSHPIMGKWIEDYSGPVVAATTVDVSVSAHKAHFYKLYITGLDLWNDIQNFMFPSVAAGYPAELGCVTNLAVALVCSLTKKRVVLAGADYGYWKGYARIADKLELADVSNAIWWKGVATTYEMLWYKDMLLSVWNQVSESVPVYSMSQGIIDEIPQVELDDILKDEWPEQLSKSEVIDRLALHVAQYKEFREQVNAE